MRKSMVRPALVALAALLLLGTGECWAQYSRRTPIVEAVEKSRKGIVTLKVVRAASWGRKEITGSGVLVDERGYLITNHHVVSGSESVRAVLYDGTSLPATVHS